MPDITPDNLEKTIQELVPGAVPSPVVNTPPSGELNLPGMGELTNIINFATTFEQRLKSIAETIGSITQSVQSEKSGNAVREDSDMSREYHEQPSPPDPMVIERRISPDKVYQAAMVLLNQIPKDLTVGHAVEMARASHDALIEGIAKEIPNLYED